MSTTPPPATTTQTQEGAPTKAERPSAGTRMPSLNQLAARINLNGPSPATAGNRPRLAASLLRTSSQNSTASSAAASTSDSVAVNPPTSRSASPAALSVSAPHSNGSTPQGEPGEPLTEDKVERLNQETDAPAVNAAPAPGRFDNYRPQVTKPKGGSGGSATSGSSGNVNGGSITNLGDYGVINKPYASEYH